VILRCYSNPKGLCDMKDFHPGVLDLDLDSEIDRITSAIKTQTLEILKKLGGVVAVSGGVDSSLTAALAARALGTKHVLVLCLPERESDPKNTRLGKLLANHLGVQIIVEDIGPVLDAFKCYERRDEAVKRIFPEYDSSFKFKIVLQKNFIETGRLNVYSLVIEDPNGQRKSKRLPLKELLEIISATSHKQRTRAQFAYYHADRLRYAVCGTPNRLEYDQGFFVKGGDGLADLKPIAHLYKTQVYSLARHLGLPGEILSQIPSTDTYSLGQTQEEFYFSLPYNKLDLILWALNHDVPATDAADVMGYTEEQVQRVYSDIKQKRRATGYLHRTLFVEPIPEITF